MKITKLNPTVSLVLGGGGARGLAHIGVIEWLVANGFIIKSIAGSSIGALIGGIYATGKLDIYTEWVTSLEKLDVIRLLDIAFRSNSLFKGERIIRVLREMIGEYYIEDLTISYTAVTTDMHAQQELWINTGPLFDAIRASIAIPTIFTPHEYLGKQLLDGSLVNPVPIAPTLNDTTDITIAVDLNSKTLTNTQSPVLTDARSGTHDSRPIVKYVSGMLAKPKSRRSFDPTLFDVIYKSMDTMQGIITGLQFATNAPDFTIAIPGDSCAFYEFYRAREMIAIGRLKAAEYLSDYLIEINKTTEVHQQTALCE